MAKVPFRDLLVQRLRAQADLMGTFTTHKTLTGDARERAILHVLREMLPRSYEALRGSIATFDGENRVETSNRQIDLMIVDTWRYPTLLRDGDTAVVFAEAVRAIVEIKTSVVGCWQWWDTLVQSAELGASVDPSGLVPRVVFAYAAGGTDEIAQCLRIWNWARSETPDDGTIAFKPLVKKGRSAATTPGVLRKVRVDGLRPVLLPYLVLGGSGVIVHRQAATMQFDLSGPAQVSNVDRRKHLDVQFARLLEYLLRTATEPQASQPGDAVFQKLQRAIGAEEASIPNVTIQTKTGTADVLDPSTSVATGEDEESSES
jgi:hypothetical protein